MKFKKILALVIFANIVVLLHASDQIKAPKKDIKILVLIIASDNFPVYLALQKSWKSYMHSDPTHVESYFIRSNPDLPTTTMIENDIIWSKVTEGWTSTGPACLGIVDKTILSIEAMLPRLHEFDYVLRTNLSSFYVFPRLLEELKKLPRKKCYFGSVLGEGIASGCGFIISTDLARLMVQNKSYFMGNNDHDDVVIGKFLRNQGVKLIPHKRFDLLSLNDWNAIKKNIPNDAFHFRVKNDDQVRLVNDILIHAELMKIFYPALYKQHA